MWGIQKRIYLVEHPQGLDASCKRQRIAQDAGGYIIHPDPEHWTGGGNHRKPKSKVYHRKELDANASTILAKRIFGEQNDRIEEYGNLPSTGFSDSSSSDRLTEEQENEIAENIYDWWISGKSYQKWYAEKFQQQDLGLE